mmetsp:Transcript_10724/g.24449  ORF Transcript_10724/g.24449 Transcript_10724/m.24449 type:complete len:245 (-) Transcript_10724:532-1266(-)
MARLEGTLVWPPSLADATVPLGAVSLKPFITWMHLPPVNPPLIEEEDGPSASVVSNSPTKMGGSADNACEAMVALPVGCAISSPRCAGCNPDWCPAAVPVLEEFPCCKLTTCCWISCLLLATKRLYSSAEEITADGSLLPALAACSFCPVTLPQPVDASLRAAPLSCLTTAFAASHVLVEDELACKLPGPPRCCSTRRSGVGVVGRDCPCLPTRPGTPETAWAPSTTWWGAAAPLREDKAGLEL